MRKLGIFILGATLSFAFSCNGLRHVSANAEAVQVHIGGMSAGFTLKAGGAQIIGMCEVASDGVTLSPAAQAGLRVGDCIKKISGIDVENIADLNEIVNKNGSKETEIEVMRGNERLTFPIQPKKDEISNRYKIGVIVRDNVSGIGTVTYVDEQGRFGALGHSVENEQKQELKISDGIVYTCSIVGIEKGIRGRAGELRGVFINDKALGYAEKICSCGIFGQISEEVDVSDRKKAVATSDYAKPGGAYIYSTVSGVCPQEYEIEIVKIDKNSHDNKNYVIKITDKKLIEETGGIVQGMSGSPILQNGKIIGAVTHVFLNDPTRGYGICIETMLKE